MLVTTTGLRLRREWPELFLSGRYLPLVTDVAVAAGLVAFARVLDDRAALFITPRLSAALVDATGALPPGGDTWKTSRIILPLELHGRTFRHQITGADVLPAATGGEEWIFAGQVFDTIPIGILTSGPV